MSDQPNRGSEPSEERRMAEWLEAAAPVPAAGFRGALSRYLRKRDPGYGPRPPRLRVISSACLLASAALLFMAALQATGAI